MVDCMFAWSAERDGLRMPVDEMYVLVEVLGDAFSRLF